MTAISASIGFNFNPLDRRSDKRDDHAFVEHLRSDPAARFLVFDGDVPLLKRGSVSGGVNPALNDGARLSRSVNE